LKSISKGAEKQGHQVVATFKRLVIMVGTFAFYQRGKVRLIHYFSRMKKKIGPFTFIFVTVTLGNYLFVDRNDIWGALFVGFFSGIIHAFVLVPLLQKPKEHLMKRLSREKYHKTE
jgi:hypothetical protein